MGCCGGTNKQWVVTAGPESPTPGRKVIVRTMQEAIDTARKIKGTYRRESTPRGR